MRKLIGITVFVCLLSFTAVAADPPKAEFFGGYQYTRIEGLNGNGWNASITGNLNDWFGVTGDFSGAYKSESGVDLNVYTYTFGPVISARANETFTPYAHALFGGFRASAGVSGFSASTNGFAMMVGGGVDIKVAPRIAVRAAQVDWMSLRAEGETSNNNVRISTGIVFRF